MNGGTRAGAGRKPGSPNRPQAERDLEKKLKAARAQLRSERQDKDDAARLDGIAVDVPDDVEPLDFLVALMRSPALPLQFRVDCAELALPYTAAKPFMGVKDARKLAAIDADYLDDEIAQAMRT